VAGFPSLRGMAGIAAQAVVVVHLAYLLYVVVGGLLGLRSLHWLWPHAVTAFWAVVGLLTQVACPLTLLEKHLIALDGAVPYAGTFIGRYVEGVFYPAGMRNPVWYATAVFVLASWALVVARHATTKRVAHH
jgi:hypothetical protein